jgi:hypothetical protein
MTQTTGRVTLPSKKQFEVLDLNQFNFAANLAPAETISSVSSVCTVYSGVDASPSSVLSGLPTFSGTIATQVVQGGVQGVIYNILVTAVTSLGQTLGLAGYLTCSTATP